MKQRILIGIMSLLMVIGTVGCGSVVRTSTKNKSTEIVLEDVSFRMPAFFLEEAEEIEEINDSLSLDKTYVKREKDSYLCMNMSSFIVYLFITEEEGITDLSKLEELFFERGFRLELSQEDAKSGSDVKGNPKMVLSKVYCEAVLSKELYEDYTGKAAIIKTGDQHVCIYAGAKGRYAELEKPVIKALDDVVYTITSDRDDSASALEFDKELTNGSKAKVSVLTDSGELTVINLTEIRVLAKDETAVYQKELKKEAPEGFEWKFLKLAGAEFLKDIKIKVKDKDLEIFETGSRTYTVVVSEGMRVDAYLVPLNIKTYLLEIGENGAKSHMTIE